jgi:hypothetical protein
MLRSDRPETQVTGIMHFSLHAKQVLYNEYGCRCDGGTVPKTDRQREREIDDYATLAAT